MRIDKNIEMANIFFFEVLARQHDLPSKCYCLLINRFEIYVMKKNNQCSTNVFSYVPCLFVDFVRVRIFFSSKDDTLPTHNLPHNIDSHCVLCV